MIARWFMVVIMFFMLQVLTEICLILENYL